MATAFQILRFRLSDNSLTVNLLSTGTSGYQLQENGYAPRSAAADESSVAVVPFEDVTEPLRFSIFAPAGSASTMRGLIRDAELLFKQAEVNDKTGFGPVCLFDMQLTGGVLMTARVKAARPQWPESFNDLLNVEEVDGATVEFTRTGWFINSTPDVGTSLAVTTAVVGEMQFSTVTQRTPAPVKVSFTLFGSNGVVPTSLFLWSDQAANNGIRTSEAENSTATNWTSIVDPVASTIAGGNILRYTPPSTAESLSGAIAQTSKVGIVSVFALLRSSISAVTWSLRLAQNWPTQQVTRYGETRILEGSRALTPTVFYLGDVTLTGGETLQLAATASTLTGSPVLDIDVFVLLNRSYGRSGAIQLGGGWISSSAFSLVFDDRTLTDRSPAAYLTDGANVVFPLDHAGPLPIVSGVCTPESPVTNRIRCLLLMPHGIRWRYSSNNTSANTILYNGSRYAAYTTPE